MEHGRFPASTGDESEVALARWMGTQQTHDLTGFLTAQQRAMLAEIPDWSWQHRRYVRATPAWHARLAAVEEFLATWHLMPYKAGDRTEVTLADWVGAQRKRVADGELSPDDAALIEALPRDLPDRPWDDDLVDASEWIWRHGSLPRSRPHDPAGRRVFSWVAAQRDLFEEGLLQASRVAALEALPGWTWTPVDSRSHSVSELRRFVDRHQRHPSFSAEALTERSLAGWAAGVRRVYRKGELDPAAVASFASIPGWWWSRGTRGNWSAALERYTSWLQEHGAPDAAGDSSEERRIARWARQQRYRYRSNDISSEQVALLEQTAGWTWEAERLSGSEAFDRCDAWYREHGRHPSRSATALPHERLIAMWVSAQRGRYHRSELTRERVAQLEAIPGWEWSGPGPSWDVSLERCADWYREHGRHPRRRSPDPAEVSLARWVTNRRHRYQRGELPSERVAQLEAIPGWEWSQRRRTHAAPPDTGCSSTFA